MQPKCWDTASYLSPYHHPPLPETNFVRVVLSLYICIERLIFTADRAAALRFRSRPFSSSIGFYKEFRPVLPMHAKKFQWISFRSGDDSAARRVPIQCMSEDSASRCELERFQVGAWNQSEPTVIEKDLIAMENVLQRWYRRAFVLVPPNWMWLRGWRQNSTDSNVTTENEHETQMEIRNKLPEGVRKVVRQRKERERRDSRVTSAVASWNRPSSPPPTITKIQSTSQ